MRAKTRHWEAHWAALGRPFRKGGGEGRQVALDKVISHARSSRDQNSVNLEFYDVFQRSLDTCSVSGTSVILMLTSRVFWVFLFFFFLPSFIKIQLTCNILLVLGVLDDLIYVYLSK